MKSIRVLISFEVFDSNSETMKFFLVAFLLVAAICSLAAGKGGSGAGVGNKDLAKDIAQSIAKSVAEAVHKDVGNTGRHYVYHYNYNYTYKFV